ncbi:MULTISPECIES: peptidoglycan-associated lipoprotein Pal [Roseobacteraceae]|uniref:peptidoglycan-associated lipoprotein Pal n=1 Tax=Roseobacteraceae TaxID=2854170 RepID=UPI00080A9C0A|nr:MULTISPECIES: peptidoglycan-associated lipoprotein Pal [Roseobacteraceae]ANT61762.1 peptidoglycan-associated lipoprotein [Salipiger sp. CCB-MM3]MCA0998153.1 peptidoglycan-associated lipoprotein Pal [Alloyangia pacifica]NDW02060.1 peptidoglycan-associated lipoprotein Pal [Salipiger sp. PrR002]NDW59677.1 peptidoglycan-associated lipoprotein Pal [Salipiger sp. PrR004]
MTYLPKVLMLVAGLGLAACTNPDRFNEGAYGAGAGAGYGAGANGGMVPGSANDPTSSAYFNQAIGDRVLFAVDQSTLSAQAQATLDAQAQWLMTNSDYLAVIEGHADEQGTREYNIALGARRANAVMEYLISKGVAPTRLRQISYGKERPVEICSEEACYAKNRRAVTVISMGMTS